MINYGKEEQLQQPKTLSVSIWSCEYCINMYLATPGAILHMLQLIYSAHTTRLFHVCPILKCSSALEL